MSAISTRGRMHFMVFTGGFIAEVICRFLDRLAGHFGHKVHLVVDGYSAHHSKKVRDSLAAHPDDVGLHFLPPRTHPSSTPTSRSTPTSSTACPSSTEPATKPNSLRRPAASSADAGVSRTTSAATSAARMPATSGREPHEFLINTATITSAAETHPPTRQVRPKPVDANLMPRPAQGLGDKVRDWEAPLPQRNKRGSKDGRLRILVHPQWATRCQSVQALT
ncbi:transposase [Streptomyces sp. NRRL B-24572]|uniref:transposase n=1 Tax=Streptomyces sp. NRRL B-24572 TaxID=1962156 RepID=UPI00277D0999|nr:transposase [Streptomyces sp. NRRL B-24572]